MIKWINYISSWAVLARWAMGGSQTVSISPLAPLSSHISSQGQGGCRCVANLCACAVSCSCSRS